MNKKKLIASKITIDYGPIILILLKRWEREGENGPQHFKKLIFLELNVRFNSNLAVSSSFSFV